jgi:hypothetical protein
MNKMNENVKDVRLQLEITPSRLKELEALMAEVGIDTKKELLNYAITFLEWAIEERKKGNIITSLNEREKTYRELFMPIFRNIKPELVLQA